MIILIYLPCLDLFVLHVLITCLNVISIKTYAYTHTVSELHLIRIFWCYIAHVYSLHIFI